MKPEIADLTLRFLERTDLKGFEVPSFLLVQKALKEECSKMEELPPFTVKQPDEE